MILDCPRCNIVNAFENKYCSKCSYPLKPEAYDEIKQSENKKFEILEEKYDTVSNTLQHILQIYLNDFTEWDNKKIVRLLKN